MENKPIYFKVEDSIFTDFNEAENYQKEIDAPQIEEVYKVNRFVSTHIIEDKDNFNNECIFDNYEDALAFQNEKYNKILIDIKHCSLFMSKDLKDILKQNFSYELDLILDIDSITDDELEQFGSLLFHNWEGYGIYDTIGNRVWDPDKPHFYKFKSSYSTIKEMDFYFIPKKNQYYISLQRLDDNNPVSF